MSVLARGAFAVAALAAVAFALAGCASTGTAEDRAVPDSVTYSQSQAVPDFDSSEHTQSDQAEIQKLVALFDQYDITPATYQSPAADGCAGGVTTKLSLANGASTHTDITINGCGADEGTFEGDATALLNDWHDNA